MSSKEADKAEDNFKVFPKNICILWCPCKETLRVQIILGEGTVFPGTMDNEICSWVRAEVTGPAPKLSQS